MTTLFSEIDSGPKDLQDWEVIETTLEHHKMGCHNLVVIDEKNVAVVAGTEKFAEDLGKCGIETVEVVHNNIYQTFGSDFHCSTHSVWRES